MKVGALYSDPEKHETITIEELAAREGIDL